MAPGADNLRVDLAEGEVVFLFIGGPHQVYHLAPAAAELSRLLPRCPVTCLSNHAATTAALRRVREALHAPAMRIESIRPPLWGRLLAAVTGRRSSLKTPLLFSLSRRLRRAAAVITPERTSAKLRGMGLRHTLMIHFRHGAGDRAPESESRQSLFDLVVVPGEKDLRRAAEKGYMPPSRLRAGGYLKLEFFSKLAGSPPRLFDNDRPVVLYNPHFDAGISSLPWARQVIGEFARQSRYNLVFAPHIRAAENMDAAEREEWLRLSREGRILVDLDSPRLIDMSYVLAADIYLGDMSSQLYEFLARPRPVVFLNAHHVAWRDDPRFAGWALGEVAETPEDVIPAIDRAVAGHPEKLARQQAAVRDAFGEIEGAALRGAQVIAAAVVGRAAARQSGTLGTAIGASA
ncbi:hypothetical protein [Pseudoroseomonas ludipueritiae]|uniref:Glycosyl transferase n=1 Tax=Pseudoroseomonas ludipueritiae TaxID=198093 RepID=A0ABR7R176_9PROT|nr:hypothetical protein [Pseudoroseomonas ludipueritiae]MBC9175491.1 hypothetical protein [Pseudoroseomonas ludipueritiae]